jgi:hypothetical protein
MEVMTMHPNDFLKFHKDFTNKFSRELESINIGILSGFLNNKEVILEFYRLYIEPNRPRIVLCGINPGRKGAGQTGIPFMDFDSLSRFMPNINRNDSERSAQFIYSVIEHFGVKHFFQQFYLTNISCIGFYDLNTGNNVNYYELPIRIQSFLFDWFSREMANINDPKIIIPLGKEVEKNLIMDLKHEKKINAEIGTRLAHPSSIHARRDDYIRALEHYLERYRVEY